MSSELARRIAEKLTAHVRSNTGDYIKLDTPVWLPELAAIIDAELAGVRDAVEKVKPYMEAAEIAGLVGDESCHWPVEVIRDTVDQLTTQPRPDGEE